MPPSDSISPGDVLWVYARFLASPKPKYALCVCAEEQQLFFFINSEPRRSKPDAQVEVTPADLHFLSHTSFINTGTPLVFPDQDLENAKPMGRLPTNKLKEVADVVANNRYLPANQKKRIEIALRTVS